MRLAVAHEWLVRYAGSERCVDELLAEFPDADLVTTILVPERVPERLRRARTSFLQSVPDAAKDRHEWLVPLMPLAWRRLGALEGYDVVVSSSHACAKAVRVRPGTPHLCYCHTPMRYAWDFEAERDRFPGPVRPAARAGMRWFRRWDREAAARVTRFLANSSAVAERIERFYGREAGVVHPPVDTGFYTPGGEREDFFLFVGRLVAYKRPDLAVDAFAGLPHRLLVVGEGHLRGELEARAAPNVEFLGNVGDEELRDLYRRARAFVNPGEEDFGIVMAEAQACGTPVVAFAGGGAADIVEPGVTGLLVGRQDAAELREAVLAAAEGTPDAGAIRARAERFSRERYRAEMRAEIERLAGP